MNQFLYSDDKRTVVYLCESKGERFRGIARCSDGDTLNVKLGERLAMCRADLLIRKRDLQEIRMAKAAIKQAISNLPQTQSKLWMQWYQDACRVEKRQLCHMHNLKDQIKNLENGIIKNGPENEVLPVENAA